MKLSNIGSANSILANTRQELGSAKGGDPFNSELDQVKGGQRDEKAAIKALSNEFESLFLGIVLKSMRDTVPKSDLVHSGNAEDIYKSMLDTEYTKQMAAQRHAGIADNIEKFLLQAAGHSILVNDASAKLEQAKAPLESVMHDIEPSVFAKLAPSAAAAAGRKAYQQLPASAIQETMNSKARKPQ